MLNFIKKKWMWLVYLILFGAYAFQQSLALYSPSDQAYLYYRILSLMSINTHHFPVAFAFAHAAALLNIVAILFLCVYILEKQLFSISFIILILLARFLCDLLGHSYEWNTIHAFYFESKSLAWNQGLTLFFWLLPSYIAMGDYIMKKWRTK